MKTNYLLCLLFFSFFISFLLWVITVIASFFFLRFSLITANEQINKVLFFFFQKNSINNYYSYLFIHKNEGNFVYSHYLSRKEYVVLVVVLFS